VAIGAALPLEIARRISVVLRFNYRRSAQQIAMHPDTKLFWRYWRIRGGVIAIQIRPI